MLLKLPPLQHSSLSVPRKSRNQARPSSKSLARNNLSPWTKRQSPSLQDHRLPATARCQRARLSANALTMVTVGDHSVTALTYMRVSTQRPSTQLRLLQPAMALVSNLVVSNLGYKHAYSKHSHFPDIFICCIVPNFRSRAPPALLKLSLETALFEAITDLACAMQLQFCDQQSAWLQDFDVSP